MYHYRNTVSFAYPERIGKCNHCNEENHWGVGFDAPAGSTETVRHFYVYSRPGGGLFVECEGDQWQLVGCSDFHGANSRAVKRWLDANYPKI